MSDIVAYYGPDKNVWRCSRCVAKAGFSDAQMRRMGAAPATRAWVRAKRGDILCDSCWEYVTKSPAIRRGSDVGLVGEVVGAAVDVVDAAVDVVGVGLRGTTRVADAAIDVVTAPIRWLFD